MPTSPVGTLTNRFAQAGFTLLEVLVTVVLIGIIASFAVFSLRPADGNDRLADEASRLAARMELSRQEAILQGEQHGVYFTEAGYAFLTRDRQGDWLSADDADLPSQHQLAGNLRLTLRVEGRLVDFTASDLVLPQVLLLSSGEATEFSVTLSNPGRSQRYVVSGDVTGRLAFGSVP